jgi:hypothetical protein
LIIIIVGRKIVHLPHRFFDKKIKEAKYRLRAI